MALNMGVYRVNISVFSINRLDILYFIFEINQRTTRIFADDN